MQSQRLRGFDGGSMSNKRSMEEKKLSLYCIET